MRPLQVSITSLVTHKNISPTITTFTADLHLQSICECFLYIVRWSVTARDKIQQGLQQFLVDLSLEELPSGEFYLLSTSRNPDQFVTVHPKIFSDIFWIFFVRPKSFQDIFWIICPPPNLSRISFGAVRPPQIFLGYLLDPFRPPQIFQ